MSECLNANPCYPLARRELWWPMTCGCLLWVKLTVPSYRKYTEDNSLIVLVEAAFDQGSICRFKVRIRALSGLVCSIGQGSNGSKLCVAAAEIQQIWPSNG